MIVICEKCKARYKLADKAGSPSIFRVNCPKCSHVFTVRSSGNVKAQPSQPGKSNQPAKMEKTAPPRRETLVKPDKGKIIAVCNRKGGVAKTSTVLNLGVSLAMLDKRVLVVDFDTQANLSIILGLMPNREKSFYDLVHVPGTKYTDVIKKTKYKNLWVLPSNSKMTLLAKKNINSHDFVRILRSKLELIRNSIDYILIDTPPSIEFFTLNALVASDFVIIPTQCEYLSVHGVAHIEEAIKVIGKMKERPIDYGILFTMFNEDNLSAKVIHKKINDKYGDKVFRTHIEYDVKLQESQVMNAAIVIYDENCPSARQYSQLAKEISAPSLEILSASVG